jgi:DNA mismatch repair protein MutH
MVEMYDKNSVESIYNFANLITGKSLDEVATLPVAIENLKNRGDLGKMIEDFFFKHQPPNTGDPDFAEAGLELKTTGLNKDSKGGYKAKERLVLTQINYTKLATEAWEKSTLLHKCQLMLIMFYLYDKEVSVVNQRFVLPPLLLEFPGEDLAQIRRDWETIKQKVDEGKAHELSEGDTFYLSACRKGSGGPNEKLVKQPFSTQGAKSRAFSLKQSYLTKLIKGHSSAEVSLGVSTKLTFEEATELKFRRYYGKTIEEISTDVGYFKKGNNQKAFNRSLANRILANGDGDVSELIKAGIQLKTIRLSKTGKLKESMSFKGFTYLDIVNQVWEDSTFAEELENKFLFVVFQIDSEGNERFRKVVYWNMPYEDREEARRVWERTKSLVMIDARNLPKSSENRVAHVRPKATNSLDTIPTPQGEYLVKKGFWLNRSYIECVINSLL